MSDDMVDLWEMNITEWLAHEMRTLSPFGYSSAAESEE